MSFAVLCGLFSILLQHPAALAAKKCLYVSSYHQGYAWSDGVEEGLRKVLTNEHCELRQIDMDTKRNKDKVFIEKTVESIRQQITDWQPDVVITSDDNAAKYLIKPYYKDADIPFVFNGVNWTAREYGFPYSNVTGIVEVAPLDIMLANAVRYSNGAKALYLGANTLTEKKNFKRMQQAAVKQQIKLEGQLVDTAENWKQAYLNAQSYDFIVMGSYSGIKDWDKASLSKFAIENARVLSVTSHEWMMPFSSLGYTKIPQEHGEWAGLAAIEILNGVSPAEIPIVANRKWDIWLNQEHLKSTGINLPRKLTRKAKKVTM